MNLQRDGAEHRPGALAVADLVALEAALAHLAPDKAGSRLVGIPALSAQLQADGPIGRIAVAALGGTAKPVRAILFNKSPAQNWSLGWHQDRTVAVRRRVDTPDFGPWTVKAGLAHVEPPFSLLERMITLRIHLDPVGPDNAPLLIAPGSHRLGRIPEPEIGRLVGELGIFRCLADRGDIWLYSTPILHASEPSASPTSRRVLQVDYSPDPLPSPLEWLGF
jgi:hypothetical protein